MIKFVFVEVGVECDSGSYHFWFKGYLWWMVYKVLKNQVKRFKSNDDKFFFRAKDLWLKNIE